MSAPSETTPARITLDFDAQTLTVTWADEHASVYSLDGLRRACPCAACQGHSGAPPGPEVFDAAPEQTWTNVRAETAGSYALRLRWDDGHDAGLYRWTYLRMLCPCAACREGEEDETKSEEEGRP